MYGGEEGLTGRRDAGAAAARVYGETGEVVTVPAYSETDQSALNYGPAGTYDYYLNAARGAVPEWRNEFAVMSYEGLLGFDPVGQASAITTPTVVVHSDNSAFPDQAKAFYADVPGEKELVWAEGKHYEYYDSPTHIDDAVAAVTRFFRSHLTAGSTRTL